VKVGIDTSVLIGLLDSRDIWHAAAVALDKALKTSGAELVMFDCTLAEAVSTLARRLHEKRREADLNALLDQLLVDFPTENILWVFPDVPFLYVEVINMVRSSGGELNFNDALIAISCRNRRIPLLASFDADFDHLAWLRRVAQPDDFDPFTDS
jgi:predicted nucleic acid-binding protein